MDDNGITAIVGWPSEPEMARYRKVAAAAEAAERERMELGCVEMRQELGRIRHALAQSGKLAEDRLQQMKADRAEFLALRSKNQLDAKIVEEYDQVVTAQITKEMVDCWRANYGLDARSPADAARYWADTCAGMAPAGAVAALGLLLQDRERWLKAAAAALEVLDDSPAWSNAAYACQLLRDCAGPNLELSGPQRSAQEHANGAQC